MVVFYGFTSNTRRLKGSKKNRKTVPVGFRGWSATHGDCGIMREAPTALSGSPVGPSALPEVCDAECPELLNHFNDGNSRQWRLEPILRPAMRRAILNIQRASIKSSTIVR